MAFFNKAGSVLRQTVCNKHISLEGIASNPSIVQMIRCMSTKLFVGGLSYNTDDYGLREAFQKYGEVIEAKVITDRTTSRSRGFGFVTYNTQEEASSAMQALDNQVLDGRTVKVNLANDKPRTFGGGYGGGGGGYGGSGGGYGGGGGNYGGGGYGGSSGYNAGGDGGNYGAGGYGGSGGNYGGSGSYGSGGSAGYGTQGDAGGNTGGSYGGASNVGYGEGQTVGAADGNANSGYSDGNQYGNSESGSVAGAH